MLKVWVLRKTTHYPEGDSVRVFVFSSQEKAETFEASMNIDHCWSDTEIDECIMDTAHADSNQKDVASFAKQLKGVDGLASIYSLKRKSNESDEELQARIDAAAADWHFGRNGDAEVKFVGGLPIENFQQICEVIAGDAIAAAEKMKDRCIVHGQTLPCADCARNVEKITCGYGRNLVELLIGENLDKLAATYWIERKPSETDADFRTRIKWELKGC